MGDLSGLEYLGSLEMWGGRGEFSLSSMRKLCQYLGNPQDKIPSIHVTGTNGKGSVSVACCSILAASGRRVGLISSPHLSNQTERVVVDGAAITEDELSSYALEIKAASAASGVVPSYFEAITALGFLAFFDKRLDFMVVEVGLGGRLDATNVLKCPEIAVITNIDFDHEDVLGRGLRAIAREKSGIFKSGTRAIIGNVYPEAREKLLESASALSIEAAIYGTDFWVVEDSDLPCFVDRAGHRFNIQPSLKGAHQLHNASLAVQSALTLGLKPEHCSSGVSAVFWPARLEELNVRGRRVILDAAHNVPGVESLVNYLKSSGITKVDLGFGVLHTKHWEEMLEKLAPYAAHWSLLKSGATHAVSSAELAAKLSSFGISSQQYGSDYNRFLDERLFSFGGDCAIPLVLTGSIYLLGELRKLLSKEPILLWPRQPV